MDIAKKLRQVVTANFIEIVKSDEDERPKQAAPSLNTVDSLPPVPTRIPADSGAEARAAAEMKARQELDEIASILESSPDVEPPVIASEVEEPVSDEPVAVESGDEVAPIEFAANPEEKEDDTVEGVVVIPIEPHAVEASPAPEPVAAPAFDPMVYVNSDGSLDVARMLKAANLPPVSFPAEQALKLISALPADLPMRVKRSTVKATLEVVSPETAQDAKDVLADAMLKRVHIGQFRDALAERVDTELRQRNEEIVRLRAELERLGGEVVEYQRRQKNFAEACENHINQFHQVVLFFQSDDAPQAVAQSAEDDEIPPFMREDTVFRLLGMNGENASEPAEEPARNGGTSSERGRGRR